MDKKATPNRCRVINRQPLGGLFYGLRGQRGIDHDMTDDEKRERRNAWQRASYARHKEKRQAYARTYYQAHRDEKIAYNHKTYAENKDKIAEQNREYYEAHKAQVLAQKREYYRANREKKLEYQNQYYKDNCEDVKASRRQRGARKRKEQLCQQCEQLKQEYARKKKHCVLGVRDPYAEGAIDGMSAMFNPFM